MPTDTPPSPALAVAAAERAVEEAYADRAGQHYQAWRETVLRELDSLLAARRAAQAAGFVECRVSREAVDLWRRWRTGEPLSGSALSALDHDLAALLKEPAK